MNEEFEGVVTVFGEEEQRGTYFLRIALRAPLAVRFGRFRGGGAVALAAGEYLYVGSAMGKKGAASLGRRLVRHATRSGDGAPHEIRALMLDEFLRLGLGSGDLSPQGGKRLFWHIDYLLDTREARLTHVLVLRSERRLEQEAAALAAALPVTSIAAQGLGASDVRGGTHLFAVAGAEGWWQGLVEMVRGRLALRAAPHDRHYGVQ